MNKFFPMLMTAAGTVAPAKVLIVMPRWVGDGFGETRLEDPVVGILGQEVLEAGDRALQVSAPTQELDLLEALEEGEASPGIDGVRPRAGSRADSWTPIGMPPKAVRTTPRRRLPAALSASCSLLAAAISCTSAVSIKNFIVVEVMVMLN